MKWSTITFRKRMLIIMTLSGLIELLILVAAGFLYLKHNQEEEMGLKALGVASFLAQSPQVIAMIEQNNLNQQHVIQDGSAQRDAFQSGIISSDDVATDTLSANNIAINNAVQRQERYRTLTKQIGAAFIVIGDKQGIRIVHPIDERIGKPMKGGDNQKALLEGRSYVSFAVGSLGYSVRGKSAVFNAQGEIIGVVSVGYLVDRLQDRIEPFLIYLLVMTFMVLGANALISGFAARRFQKAILGFEPEEIARLYVELDVTLETLKEGILSIDDQGILRSINKSACEILGLSKQESLHRPINQVLPDSDLTTLLWTPRTDQDINLYLSGQRLVANRSPIIVDGKVVGAVSSFRLRDELNELNEQLAKTQEYAEMLRSQTHEHRNKLNAIGGMVQMGELDAVQQLIGQETDHYQTLIHFLRETVKEPLVAGMLLGKTERARELGLRLVVEEGTRLDPLPERINPQDLVTILGNLIDNAFDATRRAINQDPTFTPDRVKIEVSVSDFGNEIILEVNDLGCGLPLTLTPESLVERGVSTNDCDTRGVGLFLVNQLTQRYRGELEMVNNREFGARMTVYLPKDE